MKLQTLLGVLPFYKTKGKGNPEIANLKNHHKNVNNGDLFFCIKGSEVDSHTLANEAVLSGAAAVVSERELELAVPVIIVKDSKRAMAVLANHFYGQPSSKMNLIGVTGTNGKTTTTHLIDRIFSFRGDQTGLIGTLYVKTGDEVIASKNTTPDSLTLQQLFGDFVQTGVETAIMEVSSHALYQGRVHGCDFDIAVFTNLTQDHLDYHRTMEEYKSAKSLLFSQLGNTYNATKRKFAVINRDDPSAEFFIHSTAAHVLTYGLSSDADFYAEDIQLRPNGSSFTLVTPAEKTHMDIQLAGRFNVYNVLAASAASAAADIPLIKIKAALESIKGVSGRFEQVEAGQDFSVIVDYAHTPDSLENVLKTIETITEEKVIVVVGCGGDRDRTKRPVMAEIACKYGDQVIFTSDNPRNENPEDIIEDMTSGLTNVNYSVIIDRQQAIDQAVSIAGKGDIVLIAGKGHETYQIIGNKVHSFDDREAAKSAIKRLK
ncbi:UDP-N-acetylmuramoyl-L-alanyl-D-glutamate--2,6-diaminopimelate ligase [Bacillus salacetis]|uniref:UDP-N-acetylmuramoyl-L-alanyl-D-glutamate--2,6-diaminopimelate ligase n=1 Tax=Bacillus salacetis TaxID=2315464 RepID=A0A3A1R2P5_9BACI|nr:UDP-N-acetylmuramoyl-L-alanyl-D-glutamate--2,6-diaminopimelate ligase [Bacillus salacetis]RIW36317.1 UDP-N-acetylmuramoyl-L-alanyl-D-glutamate--2,6-diaminopimelate ligase [Bacillus salacetis]